MLTVRLPSGLAPGGYPVDPAVPLPDVALTIAAGVPEEYFGNYGEGVGTITLVDYAEVLGHRVELEFDVTVAHLDDLHTADISGHGSIVLQ